MVNVFWWPTPTATIATKKHYKLNTVYLMLFGREKGAY